MKYTVKVNYYVSGSGYSHTEPFDSGYCDETFTAKEWNIGLDDPFVDNDKGWVNIEVAFYNDDDDPMFDDPIFEDEYTI